MSIIVSAGSGKDFAIHPQMPTAARCTRIIDLGTQLGEYKGKAKSSRKVQFVWESAELMPDSEGDYAGKPFLIIQRYTQSLSDKAGLRKDLEAWRGQKFTEQELAGFELQKVLGKACMLNMVHSDPSKSGGKTYCNIQSITPLPKGMVAPAAVGPLVYFSLAEFNRELFESFSDNLKAVIAKSPEYVAATSGQAEEPKGKQADIDDDDIPF